MIVLPTKTAYLIDGPVFVQGGDGLQHSIGTAQAPEAKIAFSPTVDQPVFSISSTISFPKAEFKVHLSRWDVWAMLQATKEQLSFKYAAGWNWNINKVSRRGQS